MEYRILGPLEVANEGRLLALGGPRHRRLLLALIVNADRHVSTDSLVDALWGGHPPANATAMLHVRISELRSVLRDGTAGRSTPISTRGSGYVLQLGGDSIDSRRFEQLSTSGRRALLDGDAATAIAMLREAGALWRGPPLEEVADEAFAKEEVGRLEGLYLQTQEDRYDAELLLGNCAESVLDLEGLVARYPLREHFWAQLMRAQYQLGRQTEALETYGRVRAVLMDGLGLDPGAELQRLQAAILRQDPSIGPPPAAPPMEITSRANLPQQLSSFVGRAAELAEVTELVRTHRLVTVVGVGGAGKTRLALEVAASNLPDFADGCWLVELASLSQPGLVLRTIAGAVGAREHPEKPLDEVLVTHLRSGAILLILDNCEHLLDEVAEVAHHLISACRSLTILATSRERLGITGERLHPVSGLNLPETDELDDVATADASRLLVERASAVRPDFRLDDGTSAAASEICRQLDGLPLAIELAAACVTSLELSQIAARLSDRFRLLNAGQRAAPPRHRTLRAVVDWSYELLDPADQLLFDSVAVFVGGFTLDAAQAVCGPGAEVDIVAGLGHLVDRSLVLSETTGHERRYRLLETLRAYGLERLDGRGGIADVRQRHSEYFVTLAEPAGLALRGPEQPRCLAMLELEHDNLRAALEWSLTRGSAETATRLAGSLYPFWDLHGHYSEGRRWLARVLINDRAVSPSARGRALMGAATLAVIQGDFQTADAACREAAYLGEHHDDPAVLAHALQYLGLGAIFAGHPDEATEVLAESLHQAQIAGDRWLQGWALHFSATLELALGHHDAAVALLDEGRAVAGEGGDPELAAWFFLVRGVAHLFRGDLGIGVTDLLAALDAFNELGGLWGLSVVLFGTAKVAEAQGRPREATVLVSASERLREAVGATLVPFVAVHMHATSDAARTDLGEARFASAWAEGQDLTTEIALRLAAATLTRASTQHHPWIDGGAAPPG